MSKLRIRSLEQKDIPQVENIFDKYWFGYFRSHLSDKLKLMDMNWVVAEQENEIVGVAVSREAPEQMRLYSETESVIEFYVVAVKYQGQGIGTTLRDERMEQARKAGYKEMVFFSGETHKDSWIFHDDSEFKRVGEHVAPDGERGFIWLMEL